MQRHEMIEAMRTLGLKGMAGAFDEAVTTGLQRKRTINEILTDLLRAEAAHRHAASIRYRMTAARLPVVKDLDAFVFEGTPINEGLVRSLHAGSFLPGRRNIVAVGGTGTGKTHLAIAITASVVRAGARGRYFNTVDLVTRLEEEARIGKAGALAAQLCRLDLVVLDELGYLPFARSGGQLLFHLPCVRRVADRIRRPQDDDCPARPHHAPLRHRRDRQRQLALQEPQLRPQGKPTSRWRWLRSGYALPTPAPAKNARHASTQRHAAKWFPFARR
jgi:DNA replication protein DnaC